MRMRSLTLIAMGLLLTTTATGCFGKFALTGKVYSWNDSLGNKFVKTLVFWGLLIIPVYEVCFAADYFVLNLVEFWTGKNLLADAGNADVQQNRDGSVAIGWEGKRWRIIPTGDDSFVLEREGVEIGRAVIDADGRLQLDGPQFGHVTLRAPSGDDIEVTSRALAAR